jgi:hypothetical protein
MAEKYDWTVPDDEGPEQAEKLPEGPTRLRVDRILFKSKAKPDGFATGSGDKMIMVIMQDGQGREGLMSLTCSVKAGWKIRKTCAALGNDMKGMSEAGVSPVDFKFEEVANQYLLGRCCFAMVKEAGQYLDIDPLGRERFSKALADWKGLEDAAKIEEEVASLEASISPTNEA